MEPSPESPSEPPAEPKVVLSYAAPPNSLGPVIWLAAGAFLTIGGWLFVAAVALLELILSGDWAAMFVVGPAALLVYGQYRAVFGKSAPAAKAMTAVHFVFAVPCSLMAVNALYLVIGHSMRSNALTAAVLLILSAYEILMAVLHQRWSDHLAPATKPFEHPDDRPRL